MKKGTLHIMQNVATLIKPFIIHLMIANYKDLLNSIISFFLVLQPFLLFKPCAFYRQTIEETCEKLTENTASTQLKHYIKPMGLYESTSQLRFHPDLMVYFLVTTLLKLVASSLFFLYSKILCLHRTVNNSRFNVQNLDLKLLEN